MSSTGAPSFPLTFVSGNSDKVRDCQLILQPHFALTCADVDIVEVQGDPSEIAREKCLDALRRFDSPVIVEDTCLTMSALGGLPGPYVKWFAKAFGAEGLYRMLNGFSDKSTTVVSTVAAGIPPTLEYPQPRMFLFQASVEGLIVEPRGSEGDAGGWDSCFQPAGSKRTLAEMTHAERLEHRARTASLRLFVQSYQSHFSSEC